MSEVISIEPVIRIEFSKHEARAEKRWPNGKTQEISIEDAMKEFDKYSRRLA